MANLERMRKLYGKKVYEILGEDALAPTLKPNKKHTSPSTTENVARLRELYHKQAYELIGEEVLARSLKPHKKQASPTIIKKDKKVRFVVPIVPVSPVLPGRGRTLTNFDIGKARRMFAKESFELLNGDSFILSSSKPRLVGKKRARTETIQRSSEKAKKSGKSMTRREVAVSLFSGPVEPTPLGFNAKALYDRTERSKVRRLVKLSDSFEKDRSRQDVSLERDRESHRRVSKSRKREENGLDAPENNNVKRDLADSRSRITKNESRKQKGGSDGANRKSTAWKRESPSEAAERKTCCKITRTEGGEKISKSEESQSEKKEKKWRRLESKSQEGEQGTRNKQLQSDDVARISSRREGHSEGVVYDSRRRDSKTEDGEKKPRGRGSRESGSHDEFRGDEKGEKENRGGSRRKENRSQRPGHLTSKRANGIEQSEGNSSRKQEPENVRATSSKRTVNRPSSSSARPAVVLSAPPTKTFLLSNPVSSTVSEKSKRSSAANGGKSTKERTAGVSTNDSLPSARLSAEKARDIYVKRKENADEYWCQKKYNDFEQEALQAADACFEWAIARERKMRERERHVRLNEESRMESIKPIQEHYAYLVHKVENDFVKKLEGINRKRGADTLKRIVNKARLRTSLLGSLWSSDHTTGLQSLKVKLEMNRIHEVDEGDLRLLRFVVDGFSAERELINSVSSDTGFGSQEPGTEASLR